MSSKVKPASRYPLLFALYFLLFSVVPFSHCQAGDNISLSHTGQADCNIKHLVFPRADAHCCSLHATENHSRDDHHIHFLVSDSNAPIRSNSVPFAPVPLQVAVIIETTSTQPMKQVLLSSVQMLLLRPHQGFSTLFSGLSPPTV